MASARELWATADAAIRARDWARAEAALLALRGATPRDPRVHFNLGLLMKETGRLEAVASCWRQALAADPGFMPAIVNLGQHLLRLGDAGEGVRYAEMAVGRDPRNADLLRNLALAWMAAEEPEKALITLDRALARDPAHLGARRLRMNALERLGRYGELRTAAEDLLAHAGDDPALDGVVSLLSVAGRDSDWGAAAALDGRLAAALARPEARVNPSGLMFHCDDPAVIARVARNDLGPAAAAAPPARPAWRRHDGPITVAYASTDFRDHPVAQMMLDVLRHHDRARVRIVLIALRMPDGSPVVRELFALADQVVDLSLADPRAFAEQVRRLGVEVLIDLAGATHGARADLFVRRGTPALALWLGCPVSTGLGHYDAFLLDGTVAPSGYEAWCSEPLVRLPGCYHPISIGQDPGGSRLTRADLGLPEDALVVGLQQRQNRVRPPFIDRLARTVARHPRAHLWLRVEAAHQARAAAYLAGCGLPAERVHFSGFYADRADYLQALRLIDLFVDTHPYGGHSTTGEVLALGRPVAAAAGNCIHSRVAASMLVELGLGDLVAPSQDALFAQVDRLLADPALLTAWRQRFAAATATAQPAAARHRRLAAALEDAYAHLLATAPEPPP